MRAIGRLSDRNTLGVVRLIAAAAVALAGPVGLFADMIAEEPLASQSVDASAPARATPWYRGRHAPPSARQGAKPPEPAPVPATQPGAPQPAEEEMGPLGFAGESPYLIPEPRNIVPRQTIAVPDRWRIGWPRWDRYGRMTADDPILMNPDAGDIPYTLGHPLNPYDRNVLKGDYPIADNDVFLNLSATSDTLVNFRRLPTPPGASAGGSGAFNFFGDGKQLFVSQTVFLTVDVFQGYTAFRPVDWLVRVTPAVNVNYLELRERNNVNIDVRKGDDRGDEHFTLQETFFEYHLGDVTPFFDVAAVRVGRQLFVSDFRGFVFNDISDGVRLLGNLQSNRIQYNLAVFNQNDKDTNSELNEFDWRDQQVLIANVFVQDFVWYGYTTQFSFHWNHDQSDEEFDNNGFLVIPDLSGSVTPHNIDAYYLGWASDGHIGRVNVNHAFYYVFGEDDGNPLAGRAVDIGAFLGAVELSYDVDWLRPKVSFLYASGDADPEDGRATGFDGILDNPFFAGGPSSFYQSQALRLFGVNLVSAKSFYNDLAGNKAEGQANYVNPGTVLFNVGLDAEITPKWRASLNANSIWFARVDALELFLNQNEIGHHVGYEVNLATQYRPLLNNNIILTVGGSVFFPGQGFEDVFETQTQLYQLFTGITLTY